MKYFHPKKILRLTREYICTFIEHHFVSDKCFLTRRFEQQFHRQIDWDNPQTFNEKLNWLKLNDRNPLYHKLVDKYEVKEWVAGKIGKEYVVENYGLYSSVDSIDFDALPNKFVLKCTHNSGSFVVCTDKSKLDVEEAKSTLQMGLNMHDYYYLNREWVYKGVPPRIIAERYLEDHTYDDLVNYKFWCFNGEPKIMYITVKTDDIWENYYDMNFQPVEISHRFRKYEGKIVKPEAFEEMKEVARKLSEGIPHVRVDLYQIQGKVYFSELTFYDWGGLEPIKPESWDYKIGSWIDISKLQK